MAFPPTRAAYEALINEVKLLKEENKQLRDEIKETSRSALEVELEPETRDRKASRNSWAEIYHNNTVLRKNMKLLGKDVVMDDWLDWRVKWGQRGGGLFGLIAVTCYIIAGQTQYVGWYIAFIVSVAIALLFIIGILFYKNLSLVIIKRLMKETNVIVIFVLTVCNLVIDILRPTTPLISEIMGTLYLFSVSAFIFIDTVILKSRIFVILVGTIFTFLNVYNIYGYTFTNWNKGVVLFNYTMNGEDYTFMKRSTKRSIFLQIVLFSLTGIYTMFKDKKAELMIFATGPIYRETGTASKDVEDETYSMKIKREEKKRSTNKARV